MSEQKWILVTGATSGIGLETARYLYSRGYRVVLSGRDETKLKQFANEIDGSVCFTLDLEHTDRVKNLFHFLSDHAIKLDGMVHAAGYAINMPVRSASIEHMERQMKIHYYAFVELCKHFYSRKISNDSASIVAVSSLASMTKRKGSVLYTGSKNALNAAISVASKEFVKRSIRVNGIMPAYVDTRMNAGLDEIIDIEETQPMGLIPPLAVAEIIEFLLSEHSSYITGALIPISAGMEF